MAAVRMPGENRCTLWIPRSAHGSVRELGSSHKLERNAPQIIVFLLVAARKLMPKLCPTGPHERIRIFRRLDHVSMVAGQIPIRRGKYSSYDLSLCPDFAELLCWLPPCCWPAAEGALGPAFQPRRHRSSVRSQGLLRQLISGASR